MKINPEVFLIAAQIVDGKDEIYACHAIRKASRLVLSCPPCYERKWFLANMCKRNGPICGAFGCPVYPINQQRRVLALLLAYWITQDYDV